VKNRSRSYPGLAVDGRGSRVVPNAGAVLLLRTAEAVGLDAALSAAAGPWRAPLARHDPGKAAPSSPRSCSGWPDFRDAP
jgi:hypothetical protein